MLVEDLVPEHVTWLRYLAESPLIAMLVASMPHERVSDDKHDCRASRCRRSPRPTPAPSRGTSSGAEVRTFRHATASIATRWREHKSQLDLKFARSYHMLVDEPTMTLFGSTALRVQVWGRPAAPPTAAETGGPRYVLPAGWTHVMVGAFRDPHGNLYFKPPERHSGPGDMIPSDSVYFMQPTAST